LCCSPISYHRLLPPGRRKSSSTSLPRKRASWLTSGGASGCETDKIKGNKGIRKWESARSSGDITLVLLNTMLVKVEGQRVESAKELEQFAEAVDFKSLKAFIANQ